MADSNQYSSPQSYGNPPPYPDRQRPEQQQHNVNSGSAASPVSSGELPYPNRPARYQQQQQQQHQETYSSYSQAPPVSQQTYQSDVSASPAPGKEDVSSRPAQPQRESRVWPTPPTPYNDTPAKDGEGYSHGTSSAYGENTSPPQPGYGSATSYDDTAPSSTQHRPQTYQSPAYPPPPAPGGTPPVVAAAATSPTGTYGYEGRQPGYQTPPPGPTSAAYSYSTPQTTGASAGTQPSLQQSTSSTQSGPGYGQTYNQPPGTSYSPPQGGQYGPPTGSLPQSYQQTQYMNPPPGQPGAPPPPQTPSSQPPPPGQSPVPPPAQPGQPQSGYMSGPPPTSVTAATMSYSPPPPAYAPPQGTGLGGVPGQAQQTVRINGKDYPIPAYIHTIQTPAQIDPVLNEPYFGPYLRFKNVDLQQNYWLGSILLVLPSNLAPPRVEFHPSGDFSRLQSATPQQIHTFCNYSFVRYDLALPIYPNEQRWTYAVTTQSTQTWEFIVAGQQHQWRFLAWSCNDFSPSVKQDERNKLGFSNVWKNVMERNAQEGGFHAQLGCGDQIYGDRMWHEIPCLIEWLAVKGKDQRQYWPWKQEYDDIIRHAYFHYYTSTFAKPYMREAISQIPTVFQADDHDIFVGFGSYPHYLQQSNMFQGVGKIGFEFYLLFQHHTTQQWLYQHPDPNDLVSATGTGWSFIKYFGPTTAILGLDTRAERDKHRIMSQPSYDLMLNHLRQVPPSVVHCIVMLTVPIVYPRLDAVENVLTGVAAAKKSVTGAFNLLGKAVTSVTPSGAATQNTQSTFDNVKMALGKRGMMSGVVSVFGEVDVLEDLLDHWTHANHDRERTTLIRTLQDIALNRRIRITFVSGDVHCCGVGFLYDPNAPQDYKLMFQIITSAIVNTPAPGMVIKLLHNNDKHFIPPLNSSQSTKYQSDTKEEMMELFAKDVDGRPLGNLMKLLPRRNYAICRGGDGCSEIWELCVERGRGSETIKYGPIIIPRIQ